MMKKKRNFIVGGIFIAVFAFLSVVNAYDLRRVKEAIFMMSKGLDLLIKHYYVDIDVMKLAQDALDGMTKSLDPHTVFMKPKAYKSLTTSTKGSFGGIGIYIGMRDNRLTVIAPLEGTPAYRLGIQPGDQIVVIEDNSTEGYDLDDAVSKLRGPIGTKVNIGIHREGVKDTLRYTITRAKIEIKSVPYHYIIDEKKKVGYIRITEFSATTSSDLGSALTELKNQGMKKLILDLRGNPGGLLSAAVGVVDHFIKGGKMVVYSKGRTMDANMEYYSESSEHLDIPIAVLINGGSASAAEIVTGALQDHDKAIVVGTTSFGKGSVQRLYPLANYSDSIYAMKITIAHYYIPSGRCIHRERKKGELKKSGWNVNSIDTTTVGKEKYYTDMHRVVYGGGGIRPNVIVKSDTNSVFIIKCLSKSLFFDFAVKYVADTGYNNKGKVIITDNMIDYIKKLAVKKGLEFSDENWEKNMKEVKIHMAAELRGRLEDQQARYKELAKLDNQLKVAVNVLGKFDDINSLFDFVEKIKNKIFNPGDDVFGE